MCASWRVCIASFAYCLETEDDDDDGDDIHKTGVPLRNAECNVF